MSDKQTMEYPFEEAAPGEFRALHRSLMRLHEVAYAHQQASPDRRSPEKLGIAILGNHGALARSKPGTTEDLAVLAQHALECTTMLMDRIYKGVPFAVTGYWLLVLESTLKNLSEGLQGLTGESIANDPTIYRDLMATYGNPDPNGVSNTGEG